MIGNEHEIVLFFTRLRSPSVLTSSASSQLGSRSLRDIPDEYSGSQVISQSSNSGQLKIPISLLLQNFPFQHHEEGREFLICFPTGSSPGSPKEGWSAAFRHSSSRFSLPAEVGRKTQKNIGLLPAWSCCNFLFVDYCYFPGCPSFAVCHAGPPMAVPMSLLDGSRGASLLHSLLTLILFTYPVTSCYSRPLT